MMVLVAGGEVYGPAALGRQDVLICGRSIAVVGRIDRTAVDALASPASTLTQPIASWCQGSSIRTNI